MASVLLAEILGGALDGLGEGLDHVDWRPDLRIAPPEVDEWLAVLAGGRGDARQQRREVLLGQSRDALAPGERGLLQPLVRDHLVDETEGERLGQDLAQMLSRFQISFYQQEGDPLPPLFLHREFLSDNVIRLLRAGHARARDFGRPAVAPTDLLICMLTSSRSIVAECFERLGVTAAALTEQAVIAEHSGKDGRPPVV